MPSPLSRSEHVSIHTRSPKERVDILVTTAVSRSTIGYSAVLIPENAARSAGPSGVMTIPSEPTSIVWKARRASSGVFTQIYTLVSAFWNREMRFSRGMTFQFSGEMIRVETAFFRLYASSISSAPVRFRRTPMRSPEYMRFLPSASIAVYLPR